MADNFQRAQVLYNTYILGQVHTYLIARDRTDRAGEIAE